MVVKAFQPSLHQLSIIISIFAIFRDRTHEQICLSIFSIYAKRIVYNVHCYAYSLVHELLLLEIGYYTALHWSLLTCPECTVD